MTTVRVRDRTCRVCGATNYEAYRSDQGRCKPCNLEYGRAWRRANAKRHCENVKKWNVEQKKKDPKRYWSRVASRSVRARAKERGIVCDIDSEYLLSLASDTCPALGVELDYTKTTKGDDSPSVDRLVPELGYVKGNITIVSEKANRIKAHGTLEELRMIVEWMEERHSEALLR